jgi:hypothetical protein
LADSVTHRLGLLFFALAMAAIAVVATLRPVFNWDMIPYVALAGEHAGMDESARHDRAYEVVRAEAPAKDWVLLTQASGYRSVQYANADAFDAELGMYRIKAGYVALAKAMSAFLSPLAALRAINLLSLALLTGAVLWWMHRGAFGHAAPLVVGVALLGKLPSTAQLISPDLLCLALALTGLAFLRRGPWPFAAACFAAATLVRPDFIVFPAAFFAIAVVARSDIKPAAVCFAAAAGAYALTMAVGDYPGWWAHFSVSLIARQDGLGTVPPFSLGTYFHAEARAIYANVWKQAWPSLTLLLTGCWVLLRERQPPGERQAHVLLLALLLSLAARCIAFPMPDDRLYLPTVMMLAMLVAERWAGKPRAPDQAAKAAAAG